MNSFMKKDNIRAIELNEDLNIRLHDGEVCSLEYIRCKLLLEEYAILLDVDKRWDGTESYNVSDVDFDNLQERFETIEELKKYYKIYFDDAKSSKKDGKKILQYKK
jgi:hypothetical protein